MTLEELSKKYDWNKYCISAEGVSDPSVDEYSFDYPLHFAKHYIEHSGRELDKITLGVYTRKYLGEHFPGFDDLLNFIHECLGPESGYYDPGERKLREDLDIMGIYEFETAYKRFKDSQKLYHADKLIETLTFTDAELEEFVNSNKMKTASGAPVCRGCEYLSVNKSLHKRGCCYCEHPDFDYIWNWVCEHHLRSHPRFICFTPVIEEEPTIKTSPRWCPLKKPVDTA